MEVLKTQLNDMLFHLRTISRSRLGDLARAAGETLNAGTAPLAIVVSIKLPGLESENFSLGAPKHLEELEKAIKGFGVDLTQKGSNPPAFVDIATDDDRWIDAGVIKHLNNFVGYVAAISDESCKGILPLSDILWLCLSQLEMRIHHILAPGGPLATEILGRRLLLQTLADGIQALAIHNATERSPWITAYRRENKTVIGLVDNLSDEQLHPSDEQQALSHDSIRKLWPEIDIGKGIWLGSHRGYSVIAGVSDSKNITPQLVTRLREHIQKGAQNDSEYLIKSFDKLKSDFNKLIKSERAAAITETAVTINHEINNPLTAILGNTQLMLMARDKLSPDIVAKLETIERSAIKIRETTGKLMSIIEPVTSSYASGLEMIDIEKSKKKNPQ